MLSGGYYSYAGSLTTPPCTETVTWIVFTDSLTLSAQQLTMMVDRYDPDNYREFQPVNGRQVL